MRYVYSCIQGINRTGNSRLTIGVTSCCSDEDTEIANSHIVKIAKKGQAYQIFVSMTRDLKRVVNLPIRSRAPLMRIKGDRRCHLSPRYANAYMTMAART